MRIILLLICLGAANFAQAHEKNNAKKESFFRGLESEAAIVVTKFHKALEQGDKEQILKLLDESVLVYEGGGVERSAKEYASHHLGADVEFLSKMKVSRLEHQVDVYGETAISSSRSKIQGEYKTKKIDIESMETLVLRKIKGSWKITKIHWS